MSLITVKVGRKRPVLKDDLNTKGRNCQAYSVEQR